MTFRFSPTQLAEWSKGTWNHLPVLPIKGFTTDTRVLQPGEIFVALKTAHRDGHDYLAEARARGAAGAIVSRSVDDALPQLLVEESLHGLQRIAAAWRRQFSGKIVGITGSVGKTSTKDLLGTLLGPTAFVTEANLNNTIGVPLMVLKLRAEEHRFGVIEAGMSLPGELKISAELLRPDLSIITAVAPVHLEGVGSLAGIAHEKSQLAAAVVESGKVICPLSLLAWPHFAQWAKRTIAVQFTGEERVEAVPAKTVQASLVQDKAQLVLTVDGESFPLNPMSEGLARNAALAIIAAKELGLSQTYIAKALLQWKPSAGRGSIHVLGDSIFYLDCYNSSPVSLLDAAKCFHRLSQADARPRLFVLGGMAELGQEAKVLHRQCGQQLPLRAGDSVIVWSGEAASYLEGITTPGVHKELADSLAAVHRVIENHAGYIFVKGSRSCTLEKALPAPLQSQISFH